MLQEFQRYQRLIRQLRTNGKRFAVLQVDHACNRGCSYYGQEHNDTTILKHTYGQESVQV